MIFFFPSSHGPRKELIRDEVISSGLLALKSCRAVTVCVGRYLSKCHKVLCISGNNLVKIKFCLAV